LDYQIAVKGFIEGYYANESAYPSVKDLNENFQKRFNIVESKIDNINYKEVKEILVNFGIEFNEQNEIKRSSKKIITKTLR
jgi:ABC-type methionine transport system ATPase subunit